MQRLDPNQLVREVMSIANGDLATRSIASTLHLAHELPAINGDRIQLQQVMLNLVMNAAEAMAALTGKERRLAVRTSAFDTRVRISFADHGPGFAADMHEKLFESYYTTKPQGLGLGLSISRSIVAAHGGRLWGVGEPGRGATFHVELPAASDLGPISRPPGA
jgi:C4-dicarboxylate-specific signal transduction histidine kinase